MRPEFRDELLAVADEIFQTIGQGTFTESIDTTCRLFERLLALLTPVRTREQMAAMLDSVEVKPEEEQMALVVMRAVPQFIGLEVRQVAQSVAKDFPAKVPGRKSALTQAQRSELCTFIGSLYAKGVKLKDCRKRASQRFGISVRTIERVWAKRAELPEPGTPDAATAMQWLTSTLNKSGT